MFVTSLLIDESLYSIDTTFKLPKKRSKKKSIKIIAINSDSETLNINRSKSTYVISPNGSFKSIWEVIGILVTISLFIDTLFQRSNDQKYSITHTTAQCADLYFIIDIIIRFNTGYIDENTHEVIYDLTKIRNRYLKSWFIFDIILSIPYGYIRKCWEERPAVQLLALREKSYKSIFKFIISRTFRKQVFQTFKDHLKEKTWLKSMFANISANNNITTSTLKNSRKTSLLKRGGSSIRKFARASITWIRGLGNYKILRFYSLLLKSFITCAMSLRTISLLSSSRRKL